MIVCRQCGHHNEDSDTFCGSCGTFLEWTGERIVAAEPAPPPPEPEPEPEPVHQSFLDRVKQAVGLEESTTTTGTAAEPAPEPAAAPQVPVTAGAPAPPPAPNAAPAPVAAAASPPASGTAASPPAPVAVAAPAAATLTAPVAPAPRLTAVPVSSAAAPPNRPAPAADEPVSRKPESVLPAPARPRPTRRQEPPTRRLPGDLICGQCGEGNDPARHFCRRCGNSLDEALMVRLPWYRRLWNAVFRRRQYRAGERKRSLSLSPFRLLWSLLRIAVVALLGLALILFVLVPPFRTTVQTRATATVRTVFCRLHVGCKLSDVGQTAAEATSSIAGHGPNLVIDSNTTTYWAAAPQDLRPFVHIQFSDFYDVAEFLVIPGPAGTAPTEQFKAQPRPAKVRLFFSNNQTVDLTLADQPGLQHFAITVKHVNGVEVHVLSTYPALPGSPKVSSVAITELEFQTLD